MTNIKRRTIVLALLIAVATLVTTLLVVATPTMPPDDTLVIDKDNSPDKVYAMGNKMLFASTYAENTPITLQATVTPANATNPEVDWTVQWVDAGSEWASGKEPVDYLTVSPTEDGSTTAQVACVEAFGEKIKIVVTSRDNPEAKAECVVDYAKRLQGVTAQLKRINGAPTGYTYSFDSKTGTMTNSATNNKLSLAEDYNASVTWGLSYTYHVGVGTIDDTYTTTFDYTASNALVSYLTGRMPTGAVLLNKSIPVKEAIPQGQLTKQSLVTGPLYGTYIGYSSFWTAMTNAVNNVSGSHFDFTVNVVGQYSSLDHTWGVQLASDGLSVRVTNVTVSEGTLVF